MTGKPVTQPFDLSATGSGGRNSAPMSLVIAVLLGVVAFAHWNRYFELPEGLSEMPLGLICGGAAVVFLLFGIRFYSRRKIYRVDPLGQTIQLITRGIFGARREEAIPFNQLQHVQLARSSRGSRSDKKYYFPVYIQQEGEALRQVHAAHDYKSARMWGERLAQVAHVDLHDNTQPGETRIRKPEELDVTVKEVLARGFSHRAAPSPPPLMHARLQPGMDQLTIEIPSFDISKLGAMKKGLWALLAVFGGGAAAAFYWEIHALSLFAAFVFSVMIFLLFRSETVTLTRDALSARAGIAFLKRTRRIPLAELEELHMSNATQSESSDADKLLEQGEVSRETHTALGTIVALGSAIVARSDRQTITFGRILSEKELDFILYEIEQRIRG